MKKIHTYNEFLHEALNSNTNKGIWWHGTADKSMVGKKGIHVGTKKAATQALEARIGVPAIGEWDGKREYGKTLLAGKKRLAEREKERGYYLCSGFNCGHDVPNENYYPKDRKEKAKYSDGTEVSMSSKPIIFQVSIIGNMTNSTHTPHSDTRANSMILRNLKIGNAKSGYYYINDGEDACSISAVVPNDSFLKLIKENIVLSPSDQIRSDMIKNYLEEIKDVDEKEELSNQPDYNLLLEPDHYYGYEYQTYIQYINDTTFKYYEGFSNECWQAFKTKDEYKNLSKIEIINSFINNRAVKYGMKFGYKLINSEYFIHKSFDYSDYILILTYEK